MRLSFSMSVGNDAVFMDSVNDVDGGMNRRACDAIWWAYVSSSGMMVTGAMISALLCLFFVDWRPCCLAYDLDVWRCSLGHTFVIDLW